MENVLQYGVMKIQKEILGISIAYLLAHFLTTLTGAYGYFRDELYYIACTKHLAWGYVDQPPLSIFILAINRFFFGDSLFALRLLPALCGAAFIYVVGLITQQLQGGRFAQIIACIAAAIAPVYLSIFNFYSMNSFDLLFCALVFYLLLEIINSGNEKLWITFGLLVGFALQNKWSLIFLCFSVGVGLLFSIYRRHLISKWFWIGTSIAVVINAPHFLWQIHHHLPTLEFMQNATNYKNAESSPLQFLLNVTLLMHPINLVVWLAGIFGVLFLPQLRNYRFLLYAFITVTMIFLIQNGKAYYLAPFFPVLFGAGGVTIEKLTSVRIKFLRPVIVAALMIAGLVSAPLALPFLPVETYIKYSAFLGIKPHSEERDNPGRLDQHYADMFGWPEMAKSVASVYKQLTLADQTTAAIYASNYGEAAAVDFFGKKYGLPEAISGHNSYWMWGPRNTSGKVVIIIGGRLEEHQPFYKECHQAATITNEYARSFETNLPVFVCRNLKYPVAAVWPQTREFI